MRDVVADRMHVCLQIVVGMELAAWALREGLPTLEQIRERCQCSRATAYRYRREVQEFLDRHRPRESRAA